jgi:hypothetical protein
MPSCHIAIFVPRFRRFLAQTLTTAQPRSQSSGSEPIRVRAGEPEFEQHTVTPLAVNLRAVAQPGMMASGRPRGYGLNIWEPITLMS